MTPQDHMAFLILLDETGAHLPCRLCALGPDTQWRSQAMRGCGRRRCLRGRTARQRRHLPGALGSEAVQPCGGCPREGRPVVALGGPRDPPPRPPASAGTWPTTGPRCPSSFAVCGRPGKAEAGLRILAIACVNTFAHPLVSPASPCAADLADGLAPLLS